MGGAALVALLLGSPLAGFAALAITSFLRQALQGTGLPAEPMVLVLVALVAATAVAATRKQVRVNLGPLEFAMLAYVTWNVVSMIAPHELPAMVPSHGREDLGVPLHSDRNGDAVLFLPGGARAAAYPETGARHAVRLGRRGSLFGDRECHAVQRPQETSVAAVHHHSAHLPGARGRGGEPARGQRCDLWSRASWRPPISPSRGHWGRGCGCSCCSQHCCAFRPST